MINYARRSLDGLWVGDCIGNIGQIYNVGDILKALDAGIKQYGNQLDKFQHQFQLSDDTEESIVLYNHLVVNAGKIDQDKLAMEIATRYMERDPDGEIYGYGLMTRKVLREIYDGKPWKEANQTKPRIEGPSFVDKLVTGVAEGKSLTDSMAVVNADLKKQMEKAPEMKVGSCGNGSAMRVAPLGAYFGNSYMDGLYLLSHKPIEVIELATKSAQVTHCHPEGIAGAIAVAMASYNLVVRQGVLMDAIETSGNKDDKDDIGEIYLDTIIVNTPDGEVKNGLQRAKDISYDTPLAKVIEILGNGTHVTCQDTVPFCCYMVSKALCRYPKEEMYEKSIIETSSVFGDVDTNCAIVGGIISVVSPAPEKWVKFCQPMEGVL